MLNAEIGGRGRGRGVVVVVVQGVIDKVIDCQWRRFYRVVAIIENSGLNGFTNEEIDQVNHE